MAQRVFVKVVGFSAAERHALNTVFRLSEERHTMYSLWVPGVPEAPRLLLLDGESAEGRAELPPDRAGAARLVWIGPEAPSHAWRTYRRPISWTEVLQAMDDLFAASEGLDFDLGPATDAMDTQPPEPVPGSRRALVVSVERDQRLYLRARLALAGLAMVDEVETGPQALALASRQPYCLALVVHQLPQVDAWAVLKRLRAAGAGRPEVIVAKAGASLPDRLRARLGGAGALLEIPMDPGALHAALRKAAPRPLDDAVSSLPEPTST